MWVLVAEFAIDDGITAVAAGPQRVYRIAHGRRAEIPA
jgi:hypothetical protein